MDMPIAMEVDQDLLCAQNPIIEFVMKFLDNALVNKNKMWFNYPTCRYSYWVSSEDSLIESLFYGVTNHLVVLQAFE